MAERFLVVTRVDYTLAKDDFLIECLGRGDEEALRSLYERYGRVTYSLALRILREPSAAEEVVQEVFLKLWRRPDHFVPERGLFISWLMSVTHHRAIDELRQRRRDIQGLDDSSADLLAELEDDSDPQELAWLSERRVAILSALRSLPAGQRQAIELAYFGGLSQREIAEHLHEALGTVKTRTRLGMRRLRMLLVGIQDEDDVVLVTDRTQRHHTNAAETRAPLIAGNENGQ
ncbi:MAG TPA: sigma-70 family RNA polymerase sigma factor [Chloroflexota bacterium]|nr:sigma-70 family RNA polymerase sigma factor [Chloroflexota bacterium]